MCEGLYVAMHFYLLNSGLGNRLYLPISTNPLEHLQPVSVARFEKSDTWAD